MDRLLECQGTIQRALAQKHLQNGPLVLYDITSSYLEGEHECSQLVDFGYNRDGNRGHEQIVKDGLSLQFLAALHDALKHHELAKVKFDDFKEQKKELAPQIAERSGSHLVTPVGNVVVLHRPKAAQPQLEQR